MTTEELIHILEHEEVPEEQYEMLELLLQERAEEALKQYAKGKSIVITISTGIDQFVDYIDLSEKMRDTGSTDIDNLIGELISEKIHEASGDTGWCEYDIVEVK